MPINNGAKILFWGPSNAPPESSGQLLSLNSGLR